MTDRASGRDVHLAIQVMLYQTPPQAVERMVVATVQAARHLRRDHPDTSVSIYLGDCSPEPVFLAAEHQAVQTLAPSIAVNYQHFDDNLGHAEAHNRLANEHDADVMLMMNPDVVFATDTLERLMAVVADDDAVGIVDGKQLPLEHPKRYDPVTGETSWCSGTLSLVRGRAFRDVGGFDSAAFFMHGDDVDLSWRLRVAGWKAVHHPGAVGFHDRRLSGAAAMMPSRVERFYSAESALMLAHLWGASARLAELHRDYRSCNDEVLSAALASFEAKRTSGALRAPAQRPPATAVFDGDTYGGHRW